MEIIHILPIGIFLLGYLLITLEHHFQTHKSAVALALGSVLWVIAAFTIHSEELKHLLEASAGEIFGIIVFLLAAMSLVEILNHYQFFNLIKTLLIKLKLNDKKQFLVIGVITFFLSAILDNLTITIVMTQLAIRFFKKPNLYVVTSGIIILANAGGAWSPIGDVTTIMIWLAGKFSAFEVILQTFLPSAVLGIITLVLLVRKISDSEADVFDLQTIRLSRGEKAVITACLGSFALPILFNFIGLPPYLGLLLGLGGVWILIDYAKRRSLTKTHLEANIEQFLQKSDIASIKFFIGILLSVSALGAMGILEALSVAIFGEHQEFSRVIVGNIVLGVFSAIVDNVPLTAIAIDMITLKDSSVWTLLAFTVGTGGSMLLIGSVAGVVASGIVKELTFGKYLKIAFIPAVLGYIGGIATWLLQYMLFH